MNERLGMQNLVDLLAEKHGMDKKDADEFVKEFFLLIKQALESDRCVKIKGLGTFKLVDVDSRESVKVNTGERFQIQGHTKVTFTPDTALRDVINKPFGHFESVVLNENTVLEDVLEEEQEDDPDEVVESASDEFDTTMATEESLKEEEEVVAPLEESPVEASSAEGVVPLFSTEDIIADELKKAEQEFGKIKIEIDKTDIQAEQFPPQEITRHKKREGKSAVPYLIAIIVFVLLLCGSALFFVYYPDLFSSDDQKEMAERTDPQPIIRQESKLDTLVAAKDTVAEVVPEVKEVVPEKPLKEAAAPVKVETKPSVKAALPVKPDSVNYKISGTKATHTVKEGETLTRISLRFYGTKDLWPYIVQHNRAIIKNPDNVPYGTTLRIPELVKR